jgi:hypothetical protein
MKKLAPRLAVLALALACGPEGPDAPAPPPVAGGDGGEPAGDPGGGEPGVGPGGGEPGGRVAWVAVVGGLGAEYLHDVSADGDAIVALNLVGVSGDRTDELGVHRLEPPDGREAWKRLHPLGGVPVRVPAGGLASSGGEHYVAFTATCAGSACARLGEAPVAGALLAKLTGSGELAWARPLRGEIASNVAAGGGAVAVVTAQDGVAVLHRFAADGALSWELSAVPVGRGGVAVDEGGGVIVGGGRTLAKYGAAGDPLWQVATGAEVDDVAAGPGGVVVAYAATGAVTALDASGGALWSAQADPPGDADARRVAVGPDGRVSVLGRSGCAATLTRLDADGGRRWTRPLVAGGCSGGDARLLGLAASSSGTAVSGALRGGVELGAPRREVSGPLDGFVVFVED